MRKAVRRACEPIARRFTRAEQVQPYSTFQHVPWDATRPLSHVIEVPPVELLERVGETSAAIAEHCTSGRWYVLGCGWIETRHGFSAPGFEGHRYDALPIPDELIEGGRWLVSLHPPSAVPRAQWLWNMIERSHSPLDWQRDFRSGYRWSESAPHGRIRLDAAAGADPKVPWELGRLQLLPILALEAHRSEDAAYRRELVQTIETVLLDFAAQNPPGFGIQWASAMDAAIRMANILVTLDLVRPLGLRSNVVEAIALSLYDHARFVLGNLEWSDGMRGNHYLACVAGLSVAAAYFPECRWTEQLRMWCAEQILQEAAYQFLPDGGNFEASLAYHRLAAEMLAWAVWFLRRTPEGRAVFEQDRSFASHLETIADFTVHTTYRSSIAPQIGDNDSGRFLQFIPFGDELSIEHHWCGAAHPYLSQRSHRETCALLHAVTSDRTDILAALYGSTEQERKNGYVAPSFGIAVVRTSAWEVFVRAGSIGQRGKGGHAHNDQLSVTIAFDGNEIIADTGTGVYLPSPRLRNEFRSTCAHNTLCYAGLEQNSWSDRSSEALFWLTSDRAHAQILICDEHTIVAEHKAYGVPHRRIVTVSSETVMVTDFFQSWSDAEIRFHVHPSLGVERSNDGVILRSGSIAIECCADGATLDLVESLYSHSYGVRSPSRAIAIRPASVATRTVFRLLDRS